MATYFTDEQINEILSIFRQNLGHRQYIGARYVPIFGRKGEESIEWDNSAPYEPLTIVLHQGNSFTSRQYVPAGIDINNTEFWAETGNFNAQVEQYRQEVQGFNARITDIEEELSLIGGANWNYEVGIIENKALYTLFTFPKDEFKLKLDLAVPNQTLYPGNAITQGSPVYDYAYNEKPIFACNINPSQTVIFNSILYGSDWEGSVDGTSGFFGVTAMGEPVMQRGGNFSEMLNQAVAAIGVWQPLRINGINEEINQSNTFIQPNPRQTFAWDDNNYYLFTAYGRFNSLPGLTFEECRDFAIARNWPNVIEFDGGGSNQNWAGRPLMSMSPCLSSSHSWRTEYMVLVFEERN